MGCTGQQGRLASVLQWVVTYTDWSGPISSDQGTPPVPRLESVWSKVRGQNKWLLWQGERAKTGDPKCVVQAAPEKCPQDAGGKRRGLRHIPPTETF